MTRIADIANAALTLRARVRMAGPQPSPLSPLAAPLPLSVRQSNARADLAQLMGRCHRLEHELAIACDPHPPHQARINRLLGDIAGTRREIAALQAAEEAKSGLTLDMPQPASVCPEPPSIREYRLSPNEDANAAEERH